METMDLTSPQVTKDDENVIFQLTHELQRNLNEPQCQFKEFFQELLKTVPSITLVTP
jgi:hypothetical protein